MFVKGLLIQVCVYVMRSAVGYCVMGVDVGGCVYLFITLWLAESWEEPKCCFHTGSLCDDCPNYNNPLPCLAPLENKLRPRFGMTEGVHGSGTTTGSCF